MSGLSDLPPYHDAKDIFVIHLRPEPDCTDPVKALRELLKRALRSWGLRAIQINQIKESK